MATITTTSCKSTGNNNNPRTRFIQLLDQEMRSQSNTNWVRIHAADALNDYGRGDLVAAAFTAERETTIPQYRIGVWRVLLRAATTEDLRRDYGERIRQAMLDTRGPDRLHAVETMAKLNLVHTADRPTLEQWAASTDDATAAFIRWLLVLSSDPSRRVNDEAKLTQLLDSSDPVARLRAGYALGRIKTISPTSLARMNQRLQTEPVDSPARTYLLAAIFVQTPADSPALAGLKDQLLATLYHGLPNEQLEAGIAIGRRGTRADLPAMAKALQSAEPDARIGAAAGSLNILK